MKNKYFLMLLFIAACKISAACDACEKQQPEITRGITHGAGPESNWDWVIISVITAVTIATLVFSVKYLVKPGEKNANHIKQTVLN